MKNKIVKKLSLQAFVISGTLLGGYVISNNPIISHESIILTTTCVTSGLTYMKKLRQSNDSNKTFKK